VTGVCKVCGCTDTTPCVQEVQQESGLFVTTPCWWIDSELRDLCSTCTEEDADADIVELLDREARCTCGHANGEHCGRDGMGLCDVAVRPGELCACDGFTLSARTEEQALLYDAFDRPIDVGGRK
jgi:hypothetical protein